MGEDLRQAVADALREHAHKQGIVRTWDEYARVAIPIVTAACAEVARDLTRRQSRQELCGDIATAIERLGDGPSPVRR